MKFVEQNRLELIYAVLVTEQSWSATSALPKPKKNALKLISIKIIHEEIFLKLFW